MSSSRSLSPVSGPVSRSVSRPAPRRFGALVAGAALAATVLTGCAQEEPTQGELSPSVSTESPTTDDAVTTSTAPSTTDAAPSTTAPTSDDASSTSGPTVLAAVDGGFEVELPAGWIDAIERVDTAGVQVATMAPEQTDGFFTNILVTKEKYVKNLTSAVEATAKELAGKDGKYTMLDPAEVDGNKAPGYTITREVSGKTLVQTQRWISHDGSLYVATLSSLESEGEKAAPLLDSLLDTWTWKD